MAYSYYSPRRVRRHSNSDVPDIMTRTTTGARDEDLALAGDLEQSIFIFPNPTARGRADVDPPSPLSIPTDVSFPTTTMSVNAEDQEGRSRGRGRRTSSASGVSEWTTSMSGRSVSVDTSLRSPLVEVWEMSDEDGVDLPERSPNNPSMPMYAVGRPQQHRSPLGRLPRRSQFIFSDGRFHLRARGQSFVSPIDSEKSASLNTAGEPLSSSTVVNPGAQIHRLPLLAFFSSLLAVEDATLHLLTRPSHPHVSPLFPGSRLHPLDNDTSLLDEKRAFLTLSLSDSNSASLKAGLEVSADTPKSPTSESESIINKNSMFTLPLPVPPLPFAYFVDLVKGLCSAGAGVVPMKMRLAARAA